MPPSRLLLPNLAGLSPGKPLLLGQAYGCAPAILIAEMLAAHPTPVVVLVPAVAEADALQAELDFFLGPGQTLLFPDPETLAYDIFSPHQDLVSRRLAALADMQAGKSQLIIAAAPTLLQRLPPKSYVAANSLNLTCGQALDISDFQIQLEASGYVRVSQVSQHGEFARRGALIDLFPMGSELPVRIDFFDQELESIRIFDPDTQLSGERLNQLAMLPARDFPTTPDAIREFRSRYRERFEGNPDKSLIYREISEGRFPGGSENYLPLFFASTCSLWDYLPMDCTVVSTTDIQPALDEAWTQSCQRHDQYSHDIERPVLRPDELFIPPAEHLAQLARRRHVGLSRREIDTTLTGGVNLAAAPAPALLINTHAESPADELVQFLHSAPGRVLICAESAGRREMLHDLLRDRDCAIETATDWHGFCSGTARLALLVAPVDKGVRLPAAGITVLAENELFGTRTARRRRRKVRDPAAILNDLADLYPGTPVVHLDYGVGRYQGLSHLVIDDVPGDFLTLEYAGGDRLYVPVSSLQLVSRYTGMNPENAPLHRLGTDQWAKARQKAAAQVRDVAAEMLDLYATRAARKGRAFRANPGDYERFCAAFPFELTEDQDRAIQETLADLATAQSMDRLICGDVGFGKTEVALRAAFAVAMSGGQVAVLAPTTLLAQQHFQTFNDRFADWPVNIAVLSRFRTARESREAIEGIAAGKIDIVIGTHKLLQPDIRFANLGLVVIDEEHRFGVRQKEQLKKLRAEVDVLTLTATPIPRTLNMAMGQLRELSLITTPPETRLSIKTFVTEWNDSLLREACQRELKRGGQIYFVHNRIEDIEAQARKLQSIMPEASLQIAHGQMREQDLEQIMLDFYHRRFHILVCTAIIESGIDIPSANTIIINRADRFGLAQLHQLRGRVGRSHHKAFAYLLTPPEQALTADAAKRLEAISAMEDLGAGFVLATHDLEIRGAGELLGEQQTGQIQQIGFSLYTEMLARAVNAIRRGETVDLEQSQALGPEINLRLPALLPEDYLPDVQMRLVHYKRIASAADETGLRNLQVELIDRFGLLPDATRNLFRQARIRLRAASIGISKIEAHAGGAMLTFGKQAQIEPTAIVSLVQSEPTRYRLVGNSLRISANLEDFEIRFQAIEVPLEQLDTSSRTQSQARAQA